MVRGNCDYIFLQPIFNKTQRDVIWDLEVCRGGSRGSARVFRQ